MRTQLRYLTTFHLPQGLSPYEEWQKLAWAGAFVLTAFVLILNILVRLVARIGRNK